MGDGYICERVAIHGSHAGSDGMGNHFLIRRYRARSQRPFFAR